MERFKLLFDSDGYICGFHQVYDDDYDVESTEEILMEKTKGYTRFINGDFVVDDVKEAEIAKRDEISLLEKYLEDTSDIVSETVEQIMSLDNALTFVVDILKILHDFRVEYVKTLADRKNWRERLKELRGDK